MRRGRARWAMEAQERRSVFEPFCFVLVFFEPGISEVGCASMGPRRWNLGEMGKRCYLRGRVVERAVIGFVLTTITSGDGGPMHIVAYRVGR